MSRLRRIKEKIYNIYSENLSWVKEHPAISLSPDFTEGYICPLCLDFFSRKDLSQESANPLTFDHNPPASLGGKQGVLTCRKCNSEAGHKLDGHLLKRLEDIDFFEFMPYSKKQAILDNKGNKVSSVISIDSQGIFNINVDRKNSKPEYADGFFSNYTVTKYNPFLNFDTLGQEDEVRYDFNMKVCDRSNERHAEVALLKIAYLYAFQKFGNGFIINPNLSKVREQILNPEKEILPRPFWIKYNFPAEVLGLNIINKPTDLQCFLVIFELATKSGRRQFAIALPGATKPGLMIYENMKKNLCMDEAGSSSLNLEHLYDREYARDKKLTFASYQYWKKFTSLW